MSPYPLSITGVRYPIYQSVETIQSIANDDRANQGTVVYRQFEAGRSQTALMVVRSGGIDPATGMKFILNVTGK